MTSENNRSNGIMGCILNPCLIWLIFFFPMVTAVPSVKFSTKINAKFSFSYSPVVLTADRFLNISSHKIFATCLYLLRILAIQSQTNFLQLFQPSTPSEIHNLILSTTKKHTLFQPLPFTKLWSESSQSLENCFFCQNHY